MALPEDINGWKLPDKNDFVDEEYSNWGNGYFYTCTVIEELKTTII